MGDEVDDSALPLHTSVEGSWSDDRSHTLTDSPISSYEAIVDGRTVPLEVGPDYLPTALRVRVEQETFWSRTEVAFTDWNEPIDIPVPATKSMRHHGSTRRGYGS